ncbi:MAG: SMC-Scp complex subunit ScpB [Xanthomonadales bacterium]|nr:SMC-Scp complex subunit ScpB [Xanthomonadales bacterium]
MDNERIRRIVEAALLAAGQPLSRAQLLALFAEEEAVDAAAIERALAELAAQCAGRGIELREVASGFRFQVRQELAPWISRLWTERPSRYSRALLETLALIAYRQPITRGEIEEIRGVGVSTQIIRTLEERGWIRVLGHRDVPGRPALYGTTKAFLDHFNLRSLDELPPLAEVGELPELEPELALAPPAGGEAPGTADAHQAP